MQIEIVNSSHENGFERHKAREIKMPKVLRHTDTQKAARRQTKSDTAIQLSVNDLTQSHPSNSNVNGLQFPIPNHGWKLKTN